MNDLVNHVLSCAIRGGATQEQCDSLLCWVLDLQQARRRTYTIDRARRLAELEQKLAHLEPRERARVVRERLGLSKYALHRLRKAARLREVATQLRAIATRQPSNPM